MQDLRIFNEIQSQILTTREKSIYHFYCFIPKRYSIQKSKTNPKNIYQRSLWWSGYRSHSTKSHKVSKLWLDINVVFFLKCGYELVNQILLYECHNFMVRDEKC